MKIVNITPRKNVVKFQQRIIPTIIHLNNVSEEPIIDEKIDEMIIIVRDVEDNKITLESSKHKFIIIKSLIDSTILPDINKIDEEWDELLLNKGACVHLQFIEDTWYILSSDGFKQ